MYRIRFFGCVKEWKNNKQMSIKQVDFSPTASKINPPSSGHHSMRWYMLYIPTHSRMAQFVRVSGGLFPLNDHARLPKQRSTWCTSLSHPPRLRRKAGFICVSPLFMHANSAWTDARHTAPHNARGKCVISSFPSIFVLFIFIFFAAKSAQPNDEPSCM